MNWEELIATATIDHHHWKVKIILAVKEYLIALNLLSKNPCGFKSCVGDDTDPLWAEYYRLQDDYQKAYSNLWIVTDVEYSDDEFAKSAWEWRYWSVMSRKCCYSMLTTGNSEWASETMSKLNDARTKLFEVCGLSEYEEK